MKKILLSLSAALLLFSCSKTDRTEQATAESNDPVYQYIKKLGYRSSEIRDMGNEYLVDGDILFNKNAQPDISIFSGPQTEQYGSANYVGFYIQPIITVRIDPSMNAYAGEINGAIALWNSIPNFRVHFTLTTSTAQSILITNDASLGADVCGRSYFPLNGVPGSLVRINIAAIAGNSFVQRQRTIAHELGHSIGLRHTNWQPRGEAQGAQEAGNNAYVSALNILGTPAGADANSLMNGGECGIGATVFSGFDILAAQFLYPANPPVAGSVPVFRYFSRNTTQDHFYSFNYNELGNGSNNNYLFEGIGFFAFLTQVAGSVPVYRYYCNITNDHFYATSLPGAGIPCYIYEGVAFYVYPSAVNGAVPVYRYWNPAFSDHFYTKNPAESGGYTSEGIAFYAY